MGCVNARTQLSNNYRCGVPTNAVGADALSAREAWDLMCGWVDEELAARKDGHLRAAVIARRMARVYGRAYLEAIRDV